MGSWELGPETGMVAFLDWYRCLLTAATAAALFCSILLLAPKESRFKHIVFESGTQRLAQPCEHKKVKRPCLVLTPSSRLSYSRARHAIPR